MAESTTPPTIHPLHDRILVRRVEVEEKPSDEARECSACLFIADNYGDGSATIRCQLAPGHEGLHQEQFERKGHMVTITWAVDERAKCDHGCGQWEHDHRSRYDEDAVRCPRNADDHEYSDCPFCHPDQLPQTCAHCDKTHYYEEGHLRHCAKKPFTCAVCSASGVGNHDWPFGCPKARDMALARGTADEFAIDDVAESAALAAVAEEPPS